LYRCFTKTLHAGFLYRILSNSFLPC
jgi:hypothetical protein